MINGLSNELINCLSFNLCSDMNNSSVRHVPPVQSSPIQALAVNVSDQLSDSSYFVLQSTKFKMHTDLRHFHAHKSLVSLKS